MALVTEKTFEDFYKTDLAFPLTRIQSGRHTTVSRLPFLPLLTAPVGALIPAGLTWLIFQFIGKEQYALQTSLSSTAVCSAS